MPRLASRLVVVVSLIILLAGCTSTSDDPDRSTRPSDGPLTALAERDGDIRPVRMSSGRALTYAQPETASQILCQVLAKDRWEHLFNGRVGRHPSQSEYAACNVAGDRMGLTLSLRASDEGFTAETTIAGRPAAPVHNSFGTIDFSVALTDDALRPSPRKHGPARPVLGLTVLPQTNIESAAQRELVMRVLNDIVPPLAKIGEPVPNADDQGRIMYVRTPLTGGGQIVDLPQPVQALQLCTLTQEAPTVRLVGIQVEVGDQARCRILVDGGASVVVALQFAGIAVSSSYPARVAGRPARGFEGTSMVVRLRDDAQVDLMVEAPDPAALAEKLVPLLLA